MKTRCLWLLVMLPAFHAASGLAQQQARVDSFSPLGTVKRIRQVQARFSEPMAPFGDPRDLGPPFDISCSEKGTPRWADDRNWIYDFDRDLPAGIRCEFRLREGLRSLAGNPVAGNRSFLISTGGPAILATRPYEGSQSVSEDQVFILELDSDASEPSVLAHVSFTVNGIASPVGVRIVSGAERDEILKSQYRYREKAADRLLLVQARQIFPNATRIHLVWGRGVQSPSGVATEQNQILPFVTRSRFAATFHCQRENPEAACIPITPMWIDFAAPIAREVAARIVVRGPEGRQWSPERPNSGGSEEFLQSVSFKGPFPENSTFTVELPSGITDDAGRALTNEGEYPLTVRTDEYPPLAKFAADFGILESKGNPLLPVTLRNVEASMAGRLMQVEEGQENVDPPRELIQDPDELSRARIQGRVYKVPASTANEMLYWIKRLRTRSYENREQSVFGPVTKAQAQGFSVPKLQGAKAFEVVGIPLKAPGFYVVELESELLGAALLGKPKPMYVPTVALVTNLSAHFKWGGESSLVWVTALDAGKPVADASVQIRDCEGKLHYEGKTDRDGIARAGKLPGSDEIARCSYDPLDSGLIVSAKLGVDMTFVHTSWDNGIEPWRYQLPTEWNPRSEVVNTIFDRTLFRPGETVHMKHILRIRTLAGFSAAPPQSLEEKLRIAHQGSDHKYELPVTWSSDGIAESTWTIPREATLGSYLITFNLKGKADEFQGRIDAGTFRVEEYRVPLMRAIIRAPSAELVSPSSVPVDLTVSYLNGGGAGQLPVKFRSLLEPREVAAPQAFSEFLFSNGKAKEGIFRGEDEAPEPTFQVHSTDLILNRSGSLRTEVSGLPAIERPMGVMTELDFRDPNGEVQTASTRIPLWPASWMIGVKLQNWALARSSVSLQVAVTDLSGKPVSAAPVKIDLLQNRIYSHRKRLVGGFYAYENSREVRRLRTLCSGRTDKRGLLLCEQPVSESGNLILEATTTDRGGRDTAVHQSVWVAGAGDWWFASQDSDRMDVIPEAKRYDPGEKARLQVRMPFRKATVLISVEREGVGEVLVKELSGKEPVIELTVKGSWAPNVFVSVLAVRGRDGAAQPTATVDLGRPAYRLGIAELQVGWKAHDLNVKVTTDRQSYRVREKALAKISVAAADGAPLPPGSEVALAVVDEGLLELMPNTSWDLLDAMMGRRSYDVKTSTAQMNVIGKRHFGLKALPQGGGGGKALTRELFDTLLLWKARIKLDARGQATAEIFLNDSLTSFRIVAIATGGLDRFGTGSTSVRTTQDLLLFSGLPPLIRQGDRFLAGFTLRNATEKQMQVGVSASVSPGVGTLEKQEIALDSGASKEIGWRMTAPGGADTLKYEIDALSSSGPADHISVSQKIVPAVPVRTLQSTLTQLDKDFRVEVERPANALPGVGGIRVSYQAHLADGLAAVSDYMKSYPYTCLEQVASRAVALHDGELWHRAMAVLPEYLDRDGLAKYFPSMNQGSDVLTAYLVGVADEAGLEIPAALKTRMLDGLRGFVEGKIVRYSDLPTADLTIRKLAALEALSRERLAEPRHLTLITAEPNLWPTSAVIDWLNILTRIPAGRDRAARLNEAQQILRSRLNFQGTTMGFSTDRSDRLWWLMVSVDANAARLLLSELDAPEWKQDIPRLVRGALARQRFGHWDTTVANAWGVLALEKFSKKFEAAPVTGQSTVALAGRTQSVDWQATPKGGELSFSWPEQRSALDLSTSGSGMPWATIQSVAAVPLRQPVSSGFKIERTVTPVDRKQENGWSVGDIMRIRLDLESQSDMTWVVVDDPVPAGAAILGSGLGGDSSLATKGEESKGWVWPAFQERSLEAYRAYYRYVPKGKWSFEYTVRLNNAGTFQLPPTRVEAVYAPEMFGEMPNSAIQVQ